MGFYNYFKRIDVAKLTQKIDNTTEKDVQNALNKQYRTIDDFLYLISDKATAYLEQMAALSEKITRLRFGNTVNLYAPLYISNECVNACAYCGFNVNNQIKRNSLTLEQVKKEADILYKEGFRHILIVSGESRRHVPVSYLAEIAKELSRKFASVSVEVYPMETNEYELLVKAGVCGIAVYQETYNEELYAKLHKGPKANFKYRLHTAERAATAGFRELGIGALLGLSNFKTELAITAIHAKYLMKHYWKSAVSISFPRLKNAAGHFKPLVTVSDKMLAQAIFALRIVLNDVGLVLSTRESEKFRDGMVTLGITRMSAGSKTNPGGYSTCENSLEQFAIADERTPSQISEMLEKKGLEPVWKDFDKGFYS
jgi:2-iminoacetate synthase